MATKIMALDPGVGTGIATGFTDDEHSGLISILEIKQIEPRLQPHPHESLYDEISEFDPDVLVYEPFHFRQGQLGAVTTGVEYIGVIELWAQLRYRDVYKITPSDGKAFWNDKKIRALGLWKPNHRHGMDALRILLTHLMRTYPQFKENMYRQLKDALTS